MSKYSTIAGVDLGDKYNYFCMIDASDGEVVNEGRVRCTGEAMKRFFAGQESMLIVIEAGTHSPWIDSLLTKLGHEVIVANPRKVRAIYMNARKSDKVDAAMLAKLARVDRELLYPINHRGHEAQVDVATLKSRELLVRTRTTLINHVRGIIKSFGLRVPKCSTPSFHKRATEVVPCELKSALGPILATIEETTARIKEYDRKVDAMAAERYPETQLLKEVPGIGSLTALSFVLAIEYPERFRKSRSVGAYLGLVPRRDQSGDMDKQLRITKMGNEMVRRLLVGSAQYILGPFCKDCELREWGLRLAARGGKNAKKRAVVAVARKLSVLLHRLWSTGEIYEPFPTQRIGKALAVEVAP